MRIVPRHVIYEQKLADIAKVVEIIDGIQEQAVEPGKARYHRNTEGDARVLRMIPVCAEGVGGKIPGTNPLEEILAQERRAIRRGS